MPKKLSTPLIKPRTQGGTFYTFSSALEDVGLNINELKNKVELSHYVLLDIPEFKPAENSSNFGDNKYIGDYTFAQMFQNYVLNFETLLRNQDTYNFAESLTVSERVFWSFMKRYLGMSFTKIDDDYYIEDQSSIVQAFGQISAGAQRTDSYGIYNETFVQIPSSFGKMPVLFKPVSDKNYFKGNSVNSTKTNSDGKYIIENINEKNIDEDNGVLFTGLSYETIPSSGNYSIDDDTDELCLEFSIQNLREFYNNESLTYDDIALNNDEQIYKKVFGRQNVEQLDSYNFNAVLVYYSIYDSTGKNTLATNAYGILLLNSAIVSKYANTQTPESATWLFPEIEKRKTTPSVSGNSYSFRLNIKTSSVYSRDITITDNSTPTYEMSGDFNDVIKNLTTSIDILKSNTNTIKILASEHSEIKNFAAAALDKVNDLEKDINVLKSGVSRSLTTNYLETANLKAQNILADINLFDSNNNDCGSIDGSTLTIDNINNVNLNSENISTQSLTTNQIIGDITVSNKENYINSNSTNTTKITSQGIYIPNDICVHNDSTFIDSTQDEADFTDSDQLCDNTHIYLDASLNKYFLKIDDASKEDDRFKPIINDDYNYNMSQLLLFIFAMLKQNIIKFENVDKILQQFDSGLNEKLSSIDSSLESIKSSVDTTLTDISNLEKQITDTNDKLEYSVNDMANAYKNVSDNLNDTILKYDESFENVNSLISSNTKELTSIKLDINDIDSKLAACDTSILALDASLKSIIGDSE